MPENGNQISIRHFLFKCVHPGVSKIETLNRSSLFYLPFEIHIFTMHKATAITSIKIMSDVDADSPDRTHTMIIKTDETLWASGDNLYGQLGDGTIESLRTSPVQIFRIIA
jgi:alpha-tubulin suppressor-like RCC1 family protein